MPVINFVKEKKKVEVPEGANLRKEAQKAGIQIYKGIHKNPLGNCHGNGLCGSCNVLITKGADASVKKPGLWHRLRLLLGPILFFARLGHEKEYRLACLTTVTGDIDVETQPTVNWHGEKYWA